ncbi:hypothetical protein N7528_007592 [Penicillium herquei]|nr:hypothetical protein N7528_007592 [Penicillium herquei]
MARRKYGGVAELGRQIKGWLATAHGTCPIAPCTVVVNNQYSLDDKEDVKGKFRDDLYAGPVFEPTQEESYYYDSSDLDYTPSEGAAATQEEEERVDFKLDDEGVIGPTGEGPYKKAWTHVDRLAQLFSNVEGLELPDEKDADGNWIAFYSANKYDPIEHMFPANERDARMKAHNRQWANRVIPDDKKQVLAWYGIITRGVMIIEYMARNYDEPPISEVTNALYSDLVPEDDLKYVFIHDIQNNHTRDFISKMLFSAHNGYRWPPKGAGVSNESLWRYDSDTEEYEGLMGTNVGRMVGYWLLGRYPRGTCTIPTIYIALSGANTSARKVIDILFMVNPTCPAHKLPEDDGAAVVGGTGTGPAPAPEVAPGPAFKAGRPLPGIKPAFEPVKPLIGKPIAPVMGDVPPAAKGARKRNRRERPREKNKRRRT